jgi:phage regulator Rha-like protein
VAFVQINLERSIMTHEITSFNTLSMSSRDISELCGKEHSNVMRDIRTMIDALSMDSNLNPCVKSTTYIGKDGREYAQYELDKDTTLCLISGYDAVVRMRIIKRWQELEDAVKKPLTPAQMLLGMAQQLVEHEEHLTQHDDRIKLL